MHTTAQNKNVTYSQYRHLALLQSGGCQKRDGLSALGVFVQFLDPLSGQVHLGSFRFARQAHTTASAISPAATSRTFCRQL